jgi:hypothetical protein
MFGVGDGVIVGVSVAVGEGVSVGVGVLVGVIVFVGKGVGCSVLFLGIEVAGVTVSELTGGAVFGVHPIRSTVLTRSANAKVNGFCLCMNFPHGEIEKVLVFRYCADV